MELYLEYTVELCLEYTVGSLGLHINVLNKNLNEIHNTNLTFIQQSKNTLNENLNLSLNMYYLNQEPGLFILTVSQFLAVFHCMC